MIDLKVLQNSFDEVAKKLEKKGIDSNLLEELKQISTKLKEQKALLENLQASQNAKSKLFPQYQKEGKDINTLKEELAKNKQQISIEQEALRELEKSLEDLALNIPNIPDPDVPDGKDEEDNIVLKEVLNIPQFDFTPKEHWDFEELDWIDFERGVKLSKSRFSVIKGDAAKLERALVNYMLDFNAKRGFSEVSVPYIVNKNALLGTGQLPKFEDDLFKIEGEELYLIPTAEVPLTNLYQDEIIPKEKLPIKMTSYTQCFRKEAGSAGRDTRGIIRQHQFGKVELVSIASQDSSDEIFNQMVECASDLLSSLGLPHRLVLLCGGDLGFSAAKTIDLEVWLPGQNRYREISSVSNTRDFQARRAKIRYKDEKKNILAHTLNGSSLAVGRTLIAIIENYQQKDGTVKIPEALIEYM
ncbi:MAG: serine--tRNA ligase [Sulfurospirillum sp.]|nr:MAG: serine--tRNA ligase [Sulfurospirillum sp.]